MRGAAQMTIALLALAGCRPGEGERCFCHGECRSGLVCAADGAVLQEGECVNQVGNDLEAGACEDVANVQDEVDENPPPFKFDLGGWESDPPATTMPPPGGDTTTMPGSDASSDGSGPDPSTSEPTGTDTGTGTDSGTSTSTSTGTGTGTAG